MICSAHEAKIVAERPRFWLSAPIAPHLRDKIGLSQDQPQVKTMQTVVNGYQGISLLLGLNWDRLFSVGTIGVGLLAGAFLGQVILAP